MMKFPILFLMLLAHVAAFSKTLEVGTGKPFKTISLAANSASPGDTILLADETHSGSNYITNLNGRPDAYIYITSAGNAVVSGSGEAIHLTDVSYLHISNIGFTAQTSNGVNIDDGGTYDTPSKHLIIENCNFYNMAATGNNDFLKLSGLDSSEIRNCTFANGSAGGSLIDMVGCHAILISACQFENGGSNSIQAKGGSSHVTVERCLFRNGGARAINIGGSTGLAYFRPLDANYEASNIYVYSNLFIGGQCAVAYVGAINSIVCNNTIISPTRWVARILQETVNPDFFPCSNNSFINNLCYFGSDATNEGCVNIGGNTLPNTFTYEYNFWYNYDQPAWSSLNNQVNHMNEITGIDPDFKDAEKRDYTLRSSSAAIGAGKDVEFPVYDMLGKKYQSPRSIGAYEGGGPASANWDSYTDSELIIYPNPAKDYINIILTNDFVQWNTIYLSDILGNRIKLPESSIISNSNNLLQIDLSNIELSGNVVFLEVNAANKHRLLKIAKIGNWLD